MTIRRSAKAAHRYAASRPPNVRYYRRRHMPRAAATTRSGTCVPCCAIPAPAGPPSSERTLAGVADHAAGNHTTVFPTLGPSLRVHTAVRWTHTIGWRYNDRAMAALDAVEWEAALLEPVRNRDAERFVRKRLGVVPPGARYFLDSLWVTNAAVLLSIGHVPTAVRTPPTWPKCSPSSSVSRAPADTATRRRAA